MMFTASAGINCFIILKLDANFFLTNANISVNEQPEWFHWARWWPFYTLYILTSHTRFRSSSFYRYRKRFDDLDHCFPWYW